MKRKISYEIVMFYIAILAINACVFLNGDDYMYGTFAQKGIWKNVLSYYFTGNGRFWINILDCILLYFDRYAFIIVNPLIIMLFIVFLIKNALWIMKIHDKQKEQEYLKYGVILFLCLNIMCLRESVFWITGMMNYLFPAMLFLFGIWLVKKTRYTGCSKKCLYYIVCFFVASTVEQYALMFVGIMTFFILEDLVKKRKIDKIIWIGYGFAILGLVILIFAPGNFVRIDIQEKIKPSFLDNVWTLVYQDTMSCAAFPYIMMLSLCSNILLKKGSVSNIFYKGSCLVTGILVLIQCVPFLQKAVLMSVILIILIFEFAWVFVKRNYKGKMEALYFVFVGIGSQIMLLISAIFGFRCMFSIYMVYMLLILICIEEFEKKERYFVLLSGSISNCNPIVLIIFWIIFLVLSNIWGNTGKFSIEYVEKRMIQCSMVVTLGILLLGYAQNVSTYIINIENTKSIDGDIKNLKLKELPDDTYSWYFIPMLEFHENYYKSYYELPEQVNITYTKMKK